MKGLKVHPRSYGVPLVLLINDKLPTGMRLLIAPNFHNELWDLSEVLYVSKYEMEAKECSVSVSVS